MLVELVNGSLGIPAQETSADQPENPTEQDHHRNGDKPGIEVGVVFEYVPSLD